MDCGFCAGPGRWDFGYAAAFNIAVGWPAGGDVMSRGRLLRDGAALVKYEYQ